MKRIYLLISLLASFLLLGACGGGGGDDDDPVPTDPSTVFDLTEYNAIYEGKNYFFYLEGEDSNSDDWTMSIDATVGAVVNILGTDYFPEEVVIDATYVPTNFSATSTENHYYNLSGEPVYFTISISSGEELQCLATTVYLLPDAVFIGDSGYTTEYSCFDPSDLSQTTTQFISGTWRVEDAYDGYAYLIYNQTGVNLAGNITDTEIDVFKIDAAGNVASLSITAFDAESGITVYLSTL